MAPWMELSVEAESLSSVPLPEYDVEDFGGVDVTCRRHPYIDDAPDATDFSSGTQVGLIVAGKSLFDVNGRVATGVQRVTPGIRPPGIVSDIAVYLC